MSQQDKTAGPRDHLSKTGKTVASHTTGSTNNKVLPIQKHFKYSSVHTYHMYHQ